ncbi:MAG: hypothetical protein WC972_12605 [Trueperaceae bacterium]|jgi:hypothetical protein|nr:hypothetical protein [Truepera sp.]HRN17756.1 hypothetical protein [Trueperaceae bacterium]HRQ09446.1 hypothetical protein [Trueperaceae bacterium]
MWRSLFALFLVAHGLIHASYLSPRPADAKTWPFELGHSWLLAGGGGNLRVLGLILVVITAVGFVLAGLGVLGVPFLHGAWLVFGGVAAGASLLLLGLFWHPWLVLGMVISLGILFSILWQRWPSAAFAGS